MFYQIREAKTTYRSTGIEKGGGSNQSVPIVRGGSLIWLSDKVDYTGNQKRLRVVKAYKSKSRKNAR